MFGFRKWLFRHRRDNDTLKDIKKAKDIYVSGSTIAMCQSFSWVDNIKYSSYAKIRERIPEFKPETFNVDPELLDDFWWRLSDRDSRIKAFDKLIEIYECGFNGEWYDLTEEAEIAGIMHVLNKDLI